MKPTLSYVVRPLVRRPCSPMEASMAPPGGGGAPSGALGRTRIHLRQEATCGLGEDGARLVERGAALVVARETAHHVEEVRVGVGVRLERAPAGPAFALVVVPRGRELHEAEVAVDLVGLGALAAVSQDARLSRAEGLFAPRTGEARPSTRAGVDGRGLGTVAGRGGRGRARCGCARRRARRRPCRGTGSG